MHIVYICSPDRQLQLFASIGSILTSGTRFDRITIYCIGALSKPWVFDDERICVEVKPDIGDGFWMANKTHLTCADGEKVIFIDTDTIVFKPLDSLYRSMSGDIAGRLTSASQHLKWNQVAWEENLSKYNAKHYFPYMNTGLLVFVNGANRLLSPSWLRITMELRLLQPSPFGNSSQSNQHAFSLACAASGLSYNLLTSSQHTYAWEGEDFRETVVYHTGNDMFFRSAVQIDNATGIFRNNPLIGRLERARMFWKSTGSKITPRRLWRKIDKIWRTSRTNSVDARMPTSRSTK